MTDSLSAQELFLQCADAIRAGTLIRRRGQRDKEFHFQDWIKGRLRETGRKFDSGGRNTYPDFSLVASPEGFEVKGLAYPGRWSNYDSNSQVPSGFHNGRTIFYVFGRYPAKPDGATYPVLDLVICHGDFLNADHDYEHKNKSIKGFGSYGDIMIRDRKMYVVPTPFALTEGTAHHQTLILPEESPVDDRFQQVGQLVRTEAERLIVAYTFDLRENTLRPDTIPNPHADQEHRFSAYRLQGSPGDPVTMRPVPATNTAIPDPEEVDDDDE